MMEKVEVEPAKIVKITRWLQNDVRPMERCCGHHLLAHDAAGCLITGCECRNNSSRAGTIPPRMAAK
jgi:hypothetical protein